MTSAVLAWRVEETCLNAWPALREVLLDGWLLRFSQGLTRRANSANPLRAESGNFDTLIAPSEALYRRQGLPTIFRVLSLIEPAVDGRLQARGYTSEGDSCVLYGGIDDIEAARDPDVRLLSQPDPEWFAAMAALQNHTIEQSETYQRIVGQVAIPAAFAALPIDGDIAALGYGALHNSLLCCESVVTDSRRQRRGYARRIITTLAAWAKDQRAEGACLEVEARNAPARALYETVGLKTELYRYHYRRDLRAGLSTGCSL